MFNRKALAVATWWAELLCLLATILYSAIALDDVFHGKAIITDPAWFKEGFCIWRGPHGADSHILCFVADNIIGGWLVYTNYRAWKKHKSPPLLMMVVISVFDVAHGWGHLSLHFAAPYIPKHRPHLNFIQFVVAYIGVSSFLAIGPYIGWLFGVPKRACLVIHAVSMYFFVAYVPIQFGFGAVQLVINFWYCIPRLLWIGTSSKDDIHKRVDDGNASSSIGIAMVMPIVFAEMLECQAFYRAILGHFQYDFALLVLTLATSACIWFQLPGETVQESQADSTYDSDCSLSSAFLEVLDLIDAGIALLQNLLSFAARCVSLARHCVKHGIPTITDDGFVCDHCRPQKTMEHRDRCKAAPCAEATTEAMTYEDRPQCRKRSAAIEAGRGIQSNPNATAQEGLETALMSDSDAVQSDDAVNQREVSSDTASNSNAEWDLVDLE